MRTLPRKDGAANTGFDDRWSIVVDASGLWVRIHDRVSGVRALVGFWRWIEENVHRVSAVVEPDDAPIWETFN